MIATQPVFQFLQCVNSPPVTCDAFHSGLRVCRVRRNRIDHRFLELNAVPPSIPEARIPTIGIPPSIPPSIPTIGIPEARTMRDYTYHDSTYHDYTYHDYTYHDSTTNIPVRPN